MAGKTFVSRSTALIAAIVASLVLSQPAAASCMVLPQLSKALADAPVVFVGTVVETKHDGRVATVEVEQVWKGSVGALVVVNGGGASITEMERAEANGEALATSVDRAYENGVRYLVLPWHVRGQVMSDNACSSTQPYTAKLASHAPPGTTPPADKNADAAPAGLASTTSQGNGVQTWQIVLVALGMAVVVALAFTVTRRVRRPRPSS